MMVYHSRLSWDKMIDLYKQGYDPNEIAKMYGYKNGEYITAKLRQAGVYRSNKIDKGKVFALRKAGWTVRDIAMECVASIEQIEEVLNDRV